MAYLYTVVCFYMFPQVQFAGICHSDVHIAKAANPKYTFPRVMGKLQHVTAVNC